MHRLLVGSILLTVSDACARSHSLHITVADNRTVTHAVFMFQGARQNISDYLHVTVAVLGKATTSGNEVFIDHAQITKAHETWVIVLIEGERVVGVEPAVVEVAAFPGASCSKHWLMAFGFLMVSS